MIETLSMKAVAIPYDWNSKYVDEHRRGISDMKWASMQPKGPPKYKLGDIVEFKVGGFGCISVVSKKHNGWPCSYSMEPVDGKPFHPKNYLAWHYEGDIKRLVSTTIRVSA